MPKEKEKKVTVKDLRLEAKKLGIKRFSQMQKAELTQAIEHHKKRHTNKKIIPQDKPLSTKTRETTNEQKRKTKEDQRKIQLQYCEKFLKKTRIHTEQDYINYMVSNHHDFEKAKKIARCMHFKWTNQNYA